MSGISDQVWIRKANLIVTQGTDGIDLSELRFRFNIRAADVQSPNNAQIRVYNLSDETVRQVKGEYNQVVLQAGYESSYGVIFKGTIKQFRVGRETPTETFLDILAADGDIPYNFAKSSWTLAPGSSSRSVFEKLAKDMGVDYSHLPDLTGSSPNLVRGIVGFGMARDLMRRMTSSIGATWSFQNGRVQVLPLQGYLPGEAVELNAATGMIGIPEQTDEGIRVRSLLNPKLQVGSLLKLNNKDITQLNQQNKSPYGIPFNQWTGIQYASKVADGTDGLYRIYAIEYSGDSRGPEWFSDLVCLAVSASSDKVIPVN